MDSLGEKLGVFEHSGTLLLIFTPKLLNSDGFPLPFFRKTSLDQRGVPHFRVKKSIFFNGLMEILAVGKFFLASSVRKCISDPAAGITALDFHVKQPTVYGLKGSEDGSEVSGFRRALVV